jgi:hypothetical protein
LPYDLRELDSANHNDDYASSAENKKCPDGTSLQKSENALKKKGKQYHAPAYSKMLQINNRA